MTSGLFRMNMGKPLEYTYTYEELKFILEGEFHLMDGTGQKVVARAGDLVYFPKGCKMTFDTPNTALGYFCGQRRVDEAAVQVEDESMPACLAANPPMKHIPQITQEELPKMTGSESEKNSQTWCVHSSAGRGRLSVTLGCAFFVRRLKDFGVTEQVTSKEGSKRMTSGLFRMHAGNALEYTYDYEELKFIVAGEFHLTDGTGQKVVAEAGDLMYFPKGCQMTFTTPSTALGYFCGQFPRF